MRTSIAIACLVPALVQGFGVPKADLIRPTKIQNDDWTHNVKKAGHFALSVGMAVTLAFAQPVLAADQGASSGANAKITTGGASTLQSGRTIAITRGVNLDGSDFSNQNLK